MNIKDTKKLIKNYENFPTKGIIFRDILPILQHPKEFNNLIKKMSSYDIYNNADALICIDARGFIFGTAISLRLSKPLIFARKPGKLPGDLLTEEYSLEYGKNSLSIQKESLNEFNKFVIIDDLLATGGTVDCLAKILKSTNKKILGLCVVAELLFLNGRDKFDFPIFSEITY